MTRITVVIVCLVSAFLALPALAQNAAEEPLVITESGEAYLDATRRRGVDSQMRYFDPTRPAPALDTRQKPKPPPKKPDEPGASSQQTESFVTLAAVIILGGLIWLVVRNASGVQLSRGPGENLSRQSSRRNGKTADQQTNDPDDLASILAIPDRRIAIIVLAQAALAKAASAQGMLLQRSWTGRDVLRRVRSKTQHFDSLRAAVLASERVHFGERDISDDEFAGHVDGLRPLFSENPA